MVPPADLDKWALNQGFPDLVNVAAKQTSQFDEYYNCIAHAFLDDQNWWWPTGLPAGGHDQHGCYWPMASDNRTCMQAFTDWFAKDGWTQSSSDSFDPNKQKIALYADFNNSPTHAARQLGERHADVDAVLATPA